MYDVIIAGAGVTGAFIARELSRYDVKVCLLEKGNDVATGSSKANSGIVHAGYDCTPGSLKALLNVRGAERMEAVTRELDVPFKRTGSLVLGFGEKDRATLEELLHKGIANGVKGLEILEQDRVREMEPAVSDEVTHALYAPTAGIVCPYELTVAAVENAVVNGVELRRNCEMTAISFQDGQFLVTAGGEGLPCRYFVNAGGVHSGEIAAMAGDDSITIRPRKGEYLLLDKEIGTLVSRVVFQCPTAMGKGILVTPTVDGNLMIGPDAREVVDPGDCSTTASGLAHVLQGGRRAVPLLDAGRVVTSFAGLRARAEMKEGAYVDACGVTRIQGDFIIGPSKGNPHFINTAGIESPGLTCAPAIGEYVAGILKMQGLDVKPKAGFRKERDRVVRFRELQGRGTEGGELDELLKKAPSYGRLVCRCEKVTEGEVIDCIRRPAGALDLDSVKRRTRAGMGRCQGGFCTPRLVELLSRELGIPFEEVTKKGDGSWILAGRTK